MRTLGALSLVLVSAVLLDLALFCAMRSVRPEDTIHRPHEALLGDHADELVVVKHGQATAAEAAHGAQRFDG
jgi:hypothetical protein